MIPTRYTQLDEICTFLLRFRKSVFPQDADLFSVAYQQYLPKYLPSLVLKKVHGNLTI